MKVTGNDVGTVMKYSRHKTLESFSNYIRPIFSVLFNVARSPRSFVAEQNFVREFKILHL
jgi:hypothetical protein